jgi:hypothetical protein
MNYEVIKDEKLLRDFIEWLPDTTASEQYYVCLFARSKYCKDITHIKSDKAQLKRFTSTKERLFDKIRQLECPLGSYKQYKTGKGETIDIPQEALALYITPNPRDLWKATKASIYKLLNCIDSTNVNVNPHAEVMSEIQKAKGKTRYVHFDFDNTDPVLLNQEIGDVCRYVNTEALTLLKTRGGIHVLVDPTKVDMAHRHTWHQKISNIASVDQTGDNMIPVVGCTQGNYIPHFINPFGNENIPTEGITIESEPASLPNQ